MVDISPLVKGIMAIIGVAIALGQYPRLERWARELAIEALEWKQDLPNIFPEAAIGGNLRQSVIKRRSGKFRERQAFERRVRSASLK